MSTGIAKVVLLDESTLVVAHENETKRISLAELVDLKARSIDVAVVPCDTLRIIAATEDDMHRQVAEKMPPGSVYCFESVGPATFQVIAIQQPLLEKIRAVPHVDAVIPYGIAVRDGQRAALIAFSGLITRAGKSLFAQTELDNTAKSVAPDRGTVVIDILDGRPVLTTLQGLEVRSTRVLHPEDDIERELFVTMQGVGLTDCALATHDRPICDKLRGANRKVDMVRLPLGAPSVGFLGLRKPSDLRFRTPAEMARIRRRALERKTLRATAVMGIIFAAAVILAGAAYIWGLRTQNGLAEATGLRQAAETQLSGIYRERYGTVVGKHAFDLPQAWAELDLALPTQLYVDSVEMKGESLKAMLARRSSLPGGKGDVSDAPLSLREIRQSLENAGSWSRARVAMKIESHEIRYTLEKSNATPDP